MHNLCLYLYFKTRCSYTYLSILQAGIKIFILGSQFLEKLETSGYNDIIRWYKNVSNDHIFVKVYIYIYVCPMLSLICRLTC